MKTWTRSGFLFLLGFSQWASAFNPTAQDCVAALKTRGLEVSASEPRAVLDTALLEEMEQSSDVQVSNRALYLRYLANIIDKHSDDDGLVLLEVVRGRNAILSRLNQMVTLPMELKRETSGGPPKQPPPGGFSPNDLRFAKWLGACAAVNLTGVICLIPYFEFQRGMPFDQAALASLATGAPLTVAILLAPFLKGVWEGFQEGMRSNGKAVPTRRFVRLQEVMDAWTPPPSPQKPATKHKPVLAVASKELQALVQDRFKQPQLIHWSGSIPANLLREGRGNYPQHADLVFALTFDKNNEPSLLIAIRQSEDFEYLGIDAEASLITEWWTDDDRTKAKDLNLLIRSADFGKAVEQGSSDSRVVELIQSIAKGRTIPMFGSEYGSSAILRRLETLLKPFEGLPDLPESFLYKLSQDLTRDPKLKTPRLFSVVVPETTHPTEKPKSFNVRILYFGRDSKDRVGLFILDEIIHESDEV